MTFAPIIALVTLKVVSLQLNGMLMMARYSFSGSIPRKVDHKLRRQKQRFEKIAATIVLDKDETLL